MTDPTQPRPRPQSHDIEIESVKRRRTEEFAKDIVELDFHEYWHRRQEAEMELKAGLCHLPYDKFYAEIDRHKKHHQETFERQKLMCKRCRKLWCECKDKEETDERSLESLAVDVYRMM